MMGNISTLSRVYNNTLIDSLTYSYINGGNSNQLNTVYDASGNASGMPSGTTTYNNYDGNGNSVNDGKNAVSVSYNLLNLPLNITGAKTITYTYDATGNKLRRVSTGTGNTDYVNGIEYDGTTTETLTFIQTEEGKAVPNGTGYDYQYYLGDNLGNTRVTFSTKTGTAVSVQQDDYLPFGMEILRTMPTPNPKNEYLYNKKELQEELQEYDYGARFYDPVVVHWNTIDPLAEISRRWSPYNYVEDNPIRLTDPDGMGSSLSDTEVSEVQQEEAANAASAEELSGRTGGDIGSSSLDAEVKQATQLSKRYSVNEAGELVENTLDVISFLEKLTSTFALVLLSEPMADENGPHQFSEQVQNSIDDATDIQQYNSKSAKTDQDEPKKKYLTYIKVRTNADGSITTYSGRTSGNINESDAAILRRRDAIHHMKGFSPAVRDKVSTNKYAIRGRAQQLIDYFGGAQSDHGTSGNAIRGVDKRHPLGKIYHDVANAEFGQLYKYTGN